MFYNSFNIFHKKKKKKKNPAKLINFNTLNGVIKIICSLPVNKYTLPTQIKTTKFNMPMVEYMCLIQPITKI